MTTIALINTPTATPITFPILTPVFVSGVDIFTIAINETRDNVAYYKLFFNIKCLFS